MRLSTDFIPYQVGAHWFCMKLNTTPPIGSTLGGTLGGCAPKASQQHNSLTYAVFPPLHHPPLLWHCFCLRLRLLLKYRL